MNLAPLLRLTWKEYRANRAVWLAIVGIIAAVEGLTFAFFHVWVPGNAIFSVALGAPAFFAFGSAGIAFAAEREEATLDFLRATPVSPSQVCLAKLGMTSLATLAMYLVLFFMASCLAGGRLPDQWVLDNKVFWFAVGIGAIAWGTLFSLLTARPLLAICAAIFAVSTTTHLLAWTIAVRSWTPYSWSSYQAAAPWMVLLALIVLVVDASLFPRWFHRSGLHRKRGGERNLFAKLARRRVKTAPMANATDAIVTESLERKLLRKPDRSAMLGHLLWQHWRQSGWLMLSLAGMWIAMAFALALQFKFAWPPEADRLLVGIVIFGAALVGCFVFRPDQERRQHRFFVEHNVPARYVWLTRQLPWLATVLIATLVICVVRVGPDHLAQFLDFVKLHVGPQSVRNRQEEFMVGSSVPDVDLPLAGMVLALATVSYAAGQWVSMLIRSGVIAAVVGVILSFTLCGWVSLMDTMHVSWLWSVAPLPIALLFATWWRAPDWVGENSRWSARGRAAAILLPAAILLIVLPIYRVHQVPLVAPGFGAVQSDLQTTDEARVTGDLYRRASELYVARNKLSEQKWLTENTKPLALVIEASRRPTCDFHDVRSAIEQVPLRNAGLLIELILASGSQFERAGKLDDGLDRYFLGFRVWSQLSLNTWPGAHLLFDRISEWAARKGQTVERIDAALERLQDVDANILRLDDGLKRTYVFARRRILEGQGRIFEQSGAVTERQILWQRLMPWERQRALRMLNLLTATSLDRLHVMQKRLSDRSGVVDYVGETSFSNRGQFFTKLFQLRYDDWRPEELQKVKEESDWLWTSSPDDLDNVGIAGMKAASKFAEFETWQRATKIRLAIQSYRLKHGALPKSLAELVGPYFHEMPLDPYSGLEFRYFPAGLPPAAVLGLFVGRDNDAVAPDVPFIWSTGAHLLARHSSLDRNAAAAVQGPSSDKEQMLEYRSRGWWAEPYSSSDVSYLARGLWFPIPRQQH